MILYANINLQNFLMPNISILAVCIIYHNDSTFPLNIINWIILNLFIQD